MHPGCRVPGFRVCGAQAAPLSLTAHGKSFLLSVLRWGLTKLSGLVLNSGHSCLSLSSVRITSVCYHPSLLRKSFQQKSVQKVVCAGTFTKLQTVKRHLNIYRYEKHELKRECTGLNLAQSLTLRVQRHSGSLVGTGREQVWKEMLHA